MLFFATFHSVFLYVFNARDSCSKWEFSTIFADAGDGDEIDGKMKQEMVWKSKRTTNQDTISFLEVFSSDDITDSIQKADLTAKATHQTQIYSIHRHEMSQPPIPPSMGVCSGYPRSIYSIRIHNLKTLTSHTKRGKKCIRHPQKCQKCWTQTIPPNLGGIAAVFSFRIRSLECSVLVHSACLTKTAIYFSRAARVHRIDYKMYVCAGLEAQKAEVLCTFLSLARCLPR